MVDCNIPGLKALPFHINHIGLGQHSELEKVQLEISKFLFAEVPEHLEVFLLHTQMFPWTELASATLCLDLCTNLALLHALLKRATPAACWEQFLSAPLVAVVQAECLKSNVFHQQKFCPSILICANPSGVLWLEFAESTCFFAPFPGPSLSPTPRPWQWENGSHVHGVWSRNQSQFSIPLEPFAKSLSWWKSMSNHSLSLCPWWHLSFRKRPSESCNLWTETVPQFQTVVWQMEISFHWVVHCLWLEWRPLSSPMPSQQLFVDQVPFHQLRLLLWPPSPVFWFVPGGVSCHQIGWCQSILHFWRFFWLIGGLLPFSKPTHFVCHCSLDCWQLLPFFSQLCFVLSHKNCLWPSALHHKLSHHCENRKPFHQVEWDALFLPSLSKLEQEVWKILGPCLWQLQQEVGWVVVLLVVVVHDLSSFFFVISLSSADLCVSSAGVQVPPWMKDHCEASLLWAWLQSQPLWWCPLVSLVEVVDVVWHLVVVSSSLTMMMTLILLFPLEGLLLMLLTLLAQDWHMLWLFLQWWLWWTTQLQVHSHLFLLLHLGLLLPTTKAMQSSPLTRSPSLSCAACLLIGTNQTLFFCFLACSIVQFVRGQSVLVVEFVGFGWSSKFVKWSFAFLCMQQFSTFMWSQWECHWLKFRPAFPVAHTLSDSSSHWLSGDVCFNTQCATAKDPWRSQSVEARPEVSNWLPQHSDVVCDEIAENIGNWNCLQGTTHAWPGIGRTLWKIHEKADFKHCPVNDLTHQMGRTSTLQITKVWQLWRQPQVPQSELQSDLWPMTCSKLPQTRSMQLQALWKDLTLSLSHPRAISSHIHCQTASSDWGMKNLWHSDSQEQPCTFCICHLVHHHCQWSMWNTFGDVSQSPSVLSKWWCSLWRSQGFTCRTSNQDQWHRIFHCKSQWLSPWESLWSCLPRSTGPALQEKLESHVQFCSLWWQAFWRCTWNWPWWDQTFALAIQLLRIPWTCPMSLSNQSPDQILWRVSSQSHLHFWSTHDPACLCWECLSVLSKQRMGRHKTCFSKNTQEQEFDCCNQHGSNLMCREPKLHWCEPRRHQNQLILPLAPSAATRLCSSSPEEWTCSAVHVFHSQCFWTTCLSTKTSIWWQHHPEPATGGRSSLVQQWQKIILSMKPKHTPGCVTDTLLLAPRRHLFTCVLWWWASGISTSAPRPQGREHAAKCDSPQMRQKRREVPPGKTLMNCHK